MHSHGKGLRVLLREGKRLEAQKQYLEALEVYEQAAQLDENSFDAWANVGYLLNLLERYAEALPTHERGIQLNPTKIVGWVNQGNGLKELKR
jgi:tetratricopeptide (TPR) repeat protein